MRLSTWYKRQGAEVDFMRLGLAYYPTRKNERVIVDTEGYDAAFCSCVFSGTRQYVVGENIIFGGTGVDAKISLPEGMDKMPLDYSLYPENDSSYGFISRGCNRDCYFCVVPQKEGRVKVVDSIDAIIQHDKVEFLDNNFLQIPEHKEILKALIERGVKCRFMQGLDIRMIDEENAFLLSQLNYMGEYIFAFDDAKYVRIIAQKLELLNWRRPWQLKFYVYIHPGMNLSETRFRLTWLRVHECLPYLMRDLSCWGHENEGFYNDLAAWCNQPGFFKKMDFFEFVERRHKNPARIAANKALWEQSFAPLSHAKKTFTPLVKANLNL